MKTLFAITTLIFSLQASAIAEVVGDAIEEPAILENKKDEASEQFEREIKDLRMIQTKLLHNKNPDTIIKISYDPLSPIKLKTRLAANTIIKFSEPMASFSLADNSCFKADIAEFDNRILIVNPIKSGVDTTLHVFGEQGNIYSMNLFAFDETSDNLADLTVYIERSGIPNNSEVKTDGSNVKLDTIKKVKEYMKTKSANNRPLNVNYNIRGDEDIAPIAAYDDGKFTYFVFSDDTDGISDIHQVVGNFASLVTPKFEGNKVIVEKTSKDGWEIINGDKIACVTPANRKAIEPINQE